MDIKPIDVKAFGKYIIWVKYSDNTQGNIDLSYLADKPVFSNWVNEDFFNGVYIDKETNSIAWDQNIELCPNSLYLKLKGITFEQWKTNQ
ncbi:MAG: DUF2442 domain-containing protein [Bacteroidota bacterium]|nr:DUF2442 domain-containing protein [Bacteroidota bacterium]